MLAHQTATAAQVSTNSSLTTNFSTHAQPEPGEYNDRRHLVKPKTKLYAFELNILGSAHHNHCNQRRFSVLTAICYGIARIRLIYRTSPVISAGCPAVDQEQSSMPEIRKRA